MSRPEFIKCPPAVFHKSSTETSISLQDTYKKKHAYTTSNKTSIIRSFKKKLLLVALVSTVIPFVGFSAVILKVLWRCQQRVVMPTGRTLFYRPFSRFRSLWQDDV